MGIYQFKVSVSRGKFGCTNYRDRRFGYLDVTAPTEEEARAKALKQAKELWASYFRGAVRPKTTITRIHKEKDHGSV
jgi:hypothetical protein